MRRDSLPMAAALLVAAVGGGVVAVAIASLVGVGKNTTTVREVGSPTLLPTEEFRERAAGR